MSHRQAIRFATLTAATLFASSGRRVPDEATPVIRAQLELSVCDVPDAGTDDPVSARLNGDASIPATALDHPGSDFERGSKYAYDLLLDRVPTLADIVELEVSKSGNDDLCLRELRLVVNQRTIFFRAYADGRWLTQTTGNVLRITRTELRANSAWQDYAWSLSEWLAATGGSISQAELVKRLQSCVATAMREMGLAWKSGARQPLRLRRRTDSSLSVSVDLVRPVAYWMDADVALDFDVMLCQTGRASPSIMNVVLHDSPRWYTVVLGQPSKVDDQRMLTLLTTRLTHTRPVVMPDGSCPHVGPHGDVTY